MCIISINLFFGSFLAHGRPREHHQLCTFFVNRPSIISISSVCFLAPGRPRLRLFFADPAHHEHQFGFWRMAGRENIISCTCPCGQPAKHHQHQLCLLFGTWHAEASIISISCACFSPTAGEHHQHQFAFRRMTGRENIICSACSPWTTGQASSASARFAFWHLAPRGKHHQHQLCLFFADCRCASSASICFLAVFWRTAGRESIISCARSSRTGQASSASALFASWHLAGRGNHHQHQLRLFFADCRRIMSISLVFGALRAVRTSSVAHVLVDNRPSTISISSACFLAPGRPRQASSASAVPVCRGLPASIISISFLVCRFLAHGRPREHHQLRMFFVNRPSIISISSICFLAPGTAR